MQTFDAADGNLSADQLTLRRSNLGLVLRRLRDHGPRSRARLAAELGHDPVGGLDAGRATSPSAAWSAPAASSAARVGRPGTSVELDGHAVCGIGAEVNVNHVSTMALDLTGEVVSEHRLALDARAARRSRRCSTGSPSWSRETDRRPRAPRHRAGRPRPSASPACVDRDARRAHPRPQPRLARRAGRAELLRARLGDGVPGRGRQRGQPGRARRGHAGRPAPPGRPRDLRRGRRRRRDRRRRPAAARPTGVRRRVRPHDRRAAGPPLRLRPGRLLGDGGRSAGPARPRRRPRRPGARPGPGHRRPARRDQPARRPRRHPHPGRARPGRRLARRRRRDAGQRAQPRRRSCSAATSPRSATTCGRPSRTGSGPACSRRDAGGTRVELSTLGLHRRRPRRRRPSRSSTVFADPTRGRRADHRRRKEPSDDRHGTCCR